MCVCVGGGGGGRRGGVGGCDITRSVGVASYYCS